MSESNSLRQWLKRASPGVVAAYALFAAFSTYFCMYAFRKPFAVAKFEGTLSLFGLELELKIAFVVAQLLGYTASKFIGIKVVSEVTNERRASTIAFAIAVAELALCGFALAPAGLKPMLLFVNGLSLGLIWGLVFGFIEGRELSDLMGAGLAVSFIVASGFVKSAGQVVLGWGIAEAWMPALTGALFTPAIGLSVFLLAQLPPPTAGDQRARSPRIPMDRRARSDFFGSLAPGLCLLTVAYVLLSAYRDFRDNFAREIWDALGYASAPEILTFAEVPVALGALIAVGAVILVKNNARAILAIHALLLGGALLIGLSTLAFQLGIIEPALWMILIGVGLYIGYVPYNCVLFDRLLPAVGAVGTAGFMIYVTDSLGYLASSALLLYKNFAAPKLPWLDFMIAFSWATAGLCALLFFASALYFQRRTSGH